MINSTRFLLLILAVTFSSFSHSQNSLSIEDHWSLTNLRFEIILKKELTDEACNRNIGQFMGCLQALNTGLTILDNATVFFVTSDENSQNPLPKFSSQTISRSELTREGLKSLARGYYSSSKKFFEKRQEGLYVLRPVPFQEAFMALNARIIKERNEQQITGSIYNAYLGNAFDPHTYVIPLLYMYERMSGSSSTTKIFGITYEELLYKNKNSILIRSIVPNSPVHKAGIEVGDIIVRINSETDFSKMVKELSQDTVEMEVDGSQGQRSLSISREQVSVSNLSSKIIKNGEKSYSYIKYSSFSDSDSCNKIAQIGKKHMDIGVDGVILDLRGNGGGQVSLHKCIAGLFVEKGATTWLSKDLTSGRIEKDIQKTDAKVFTDIHTVVLIDGHSASASESLSIFLQAYRKAYVVGVKSFGKGTMQSIGYFQHDITVARASTVAVFYGPHGASPQIQGVIPDFEVSNLNGKGMPLEYSREIDIYENAIPTQLTKAPEMDDRKEEIALIADCKKDKDFIQLELESLDSFKKRVFDYQLSTAKAVIDCANESNIPFFNSLDIPMVEID